MTVYSCPIDGCDYTNESDGSVIAHAVGKKDEAHAGLAYQEVKQAVEGGDAVEAEPVDEASTDEASTDEIESNGSDGGVTPFDGPDYTPPGHDVSADTWPVQAGQEVRAVDGTVYQTDAGDRIGPDGDIELAAGQTLRTSDGATIQTDDGDKL